MAWTRVVLSGMSWAISQILERTHWDWHPKSKNMSIFLENRPLSIFWPKTCQFTDNCHFLIQVDSDREILSTFWQERCQFFWKTAIWAYFDRKRVNLHTTGTFWAWNYQKRSLRSLDRISLEGFVSSWAIKRRKHRQAPTIVTTFEWFCVELSNQTPETSSSSYYYYDILMVLCRAEQWDAGFITQL